MAISSERLQELMAIYGKLKERIFAIDAKYSLEYAEPKIDLPDSLNLQKMTYTPKSESELKALAEQYVAPAVLSKQRTLDSSYSTKVKSFSRKREQIQLAHLDDLKKIDADYAKTLEDVERKLTNNGLIFSTTATTYRESAAADYNDKKEESNEGMLADMRAVNSEEADCDAVYNTACEQLNAEWKSLVNKRYQALVEAEQKAKANVDKYNNSIEEKEQRYKYTREKFIETMRRAERDRMLTMTKLYLQLGDVTYRDRMLREKYAAAQDAFWPLRRNEALALVNYDSFLSDQLEKYYNTFVDWINTMLLV